ncbi:uncharacterized protein N7515_004213 [Penicillium bovifimosum]|uniref:GAR domain-containing protein n=1 Tax=Penicillium bovifimosum TaxID=126998 RepID=A0A9W9L6Y7_9EURO|nr:uncharacterized protein N7515_004213 [Penicillium bovifimosum]KAJ5139365.1 hypothetical protein N7515_004213 [Penicillium bovifimosum]
MAASRINPNRPSIRLSPVHSRHNSRSTSPERIPSSIFQKLDPLLSNLSPESTLEALTSTDAVPSNEQGVRDILSQSISQVSQTERALGIRAAVAAQNLSLWHKEVVSWQWPNQQDAKTGKGFLPPRESNHKGNPSLPGLLSAPRNPEESYYGSLPASVVEQYESRIDEIRDAMEDLNVEELKEHVLNAHIPSRSRPSSATSCSSVPPPLSYVQLSDFTAVVTATILRALPYLSRLNALLATWDVRLFVLRQVPGLLRELTLTRSALDSASRALRTPHSSITGSDRYPDASLSADHVNLESAVVAVGRRMDRVLDALEGRLDSLPEQWIDDLESIESDFAAWVVEAEQYKVQTEWFRSKAESEMAQARAADQLLVTESVEQIRQDSSASEAAAQEPAGHESLVSPEQAVESETECQCGPELPSVEARAPSPQYVQHATSPDECLGGNTLPDLKLPTSLAKPQIDKPKENLTPLPVADDLETPTQSDFPPAPAISRQAFPTPAQTLCADDCDLENKENVPPSGFQHPDGMSPVCQTPSTKSSPLSEHGASAAGSSIQPVTASDAEAQLSGDTASVLKGATVEFDVCLDREELPTETATGLEKEKQSVGETQANTHSRSTEHTPKTISSVGQRSRLPARSNRRNESDTPVAAVISPVSTPNWSETRLPQSRQSVRGSQIPMAVPSPKPGSSSTPIKSHASNEAIADPSQRTVRKPLQSPIKLSKSRPVEKDAKAHKTKHRRGTSNGSVGSSLSGRSSLISSPEVQAPHTVSSNVTSLGASPRPGSLHRPSHGDYTLREDRLRRLEDQKPDPRVSFQQSRTVSLPLERFINERLEMGLGPESAPDLAVVKSSTTRSVTSADFPQPPKKHTRSFFGAHSTPGLATRRPQLCRGKSANDLHSQNERSKIAQQNKTTFGMNSARRAIEHLTQPRSLRLRQRLTAHPSLESLGMKRQELSYVEEHESELTDSGSRAPSSHSKRPRDQLDEKINSILNSLPGHIHLVDSNHEADTSSSSSSMDRRRRYRSESPTVPARSTTPAPSLTLMPAARRRQSHAFKTEDSCVKLYHLHHGGQSAPTKLFVRTVGEDGQRVMVRVGGGWADLGEYLREYVIHHGHRKVSETPRVEVQGINPRPSPPFVSPSSLLTPAPSALLSSGRATPSRSPSVLSSRAPSSLTVRKKRRGSAASEIMANRAVTTGHISHIPHLSSFTSPPPPISHLPSSADRRLSVSSGYSIGDTHSPAQTATALASEPRATPLGLAGPRPRARYESMSPEGEAWVADVLQKTRRPSSHAPQFALSIPPDHDDDRSEFDGLGHHLPKVRSIGDIGSTGTSRRVVLKGLGGRR